MNNGPKFSIVTPSYNQGHFIEATILSVLNQSYANLEYIVMDGGSTDGSVEIIKAYESELAYWQSGSDGGQAEAIHNGFTRCTGDIFGWLNSDDILLPGAVEKAARYFSDHPNCKVVIGNSKRIDSNGREIDRIWPLALDYRRILYWATKFDQPASFWTRDIYFSAGGLNTKYQFCFDYDLFLRMSRYARIDICNAYLAALRIHDSTKTANLQHVMRREMAEIRRKNGFLKPNLFRFMYKVWHEFFYRCYRIQRKFSSSV